MKYILAILIGLSGCAGTQELRDLRPAVDLSPVGCGHKWFQSGYSPTIQSACSLDRSSIRSAHRGLALDHAWEVARTKCPDVCPPVELSDSVEAVKRFPDGVCRDGLVYFTERIFVQCGS